jgi:hypothetical protein
MIPTGPTGSILPTPFKKPPVGGAQNVRSYRIYRSLLEIPMAVRYDAFISINPSFGGSQLGFALGIRMGSTPSFPDEGESK